jgi:glycosyltransferase involved in cell wall biosynthesis
LPKDVNCNKNDRKLKILIAIPAYNEERYIGNVVRKAKIYATEVIVIDDASKDNTSQIAKEAGAFVIKHEINKRYGGAIKSCFQVAKDKDADILVILDGDGQHDPKDIPNLLKPILDGQADIVIGSRFLNKSNDIPLYRKFGINVITFLFNFCSKTKVTDSQSGFRSYNRNALSLLGSLEEDCMGVSVEIIIKARKKRLIIKEVPINVKYYEDSSTLNPVIHGVSVALTVLKLRTKYVALK